MDIQCNVPKSYSCPRCNYKSKIIYDYETSDPHRFALERAKEHAKRHLERHYRCHIFKNRVDLQPLKSEDGSFYYYQCSLCDFQSKVNQKRKSKHYEARLGLTRHFMKCHERRIWRTKTGCPPSVSNELDPKSESSNVNRETPTKVEIPHSVRRRVKRNQCPLCDFEANLDSGVKEQVTKNKAQQMTKEILTKHFTELHNPVQVDEISLSEETGDDYYGCTMCDFRSEINGNSCAEIEEGRVEARDVLSAHYIDEHYKRHGRVFIASVDDHEPLQTIPCSESGCTFSTSFRYSNKPYIKSKNRRTALVKLAKHSIKVHDCPEGNQRGIFNKLLTRVGESQEGYKCYRCDHISIVEAVDEDRKNIARAQSTAFNKFLTAKDPFSGKQFFQSFKFKDTELVSKLKCTLCKYKTLRPTSRNRKYNQRYVIAIEMKRIMFRHYTTVHPGVNFPNFQMYVPKSKIAEEEVENSSSSDSDDHTTTIAANKAEDVPQQDLITDGANKLYDDSDINNAILDDVTLEEFKYEPDADRDDDFDCGV
jgi:hypothetical protein